MFWSLRRKYKVDNSSGGPFLVEIYSPCSNVMKSPVISFRPLKVGTQFYSTKTKMLAHVFKLFQLGNIQQTRCKKRENKFFSSIASMVLFVSTLPEQFQCRKHVVVSTRVRGRLVCLSLVLALALFINVADYNAEPMELENWNKA
jgi:hypothetical protein